MRIVLFWLANSSSLKIGTLSLWINVLWLELISHSQIAQKKDQKQRKIFWWRHQSKSLCQYFAICYISFESSLNSVFKYANITCIYWVCQKLQQFLYTFRPILWRHLSRDNETFPGMVRLLKLLRITYSSDTNLKKLS